MIRNGYARKLQAEAERARLAEQWQAYPEAVRRCLQAFLQDYGLRAAALATEAVEQAGTRQPDSARIPAPVVSESKTAFPAVTHRCLYQGPGGGCFRSTGSVFMRYCLVHQDVLLPP